MENSKKTYTKVSISGDIGSGKSLVCRILSEKLRLRKISIGDLHRNLAIKYKMNTLEFNKYAETHPEIDEECDSMLAKLSERDECLSLDARMAWHFISNSFKIYLLVDNRVAAQRIFNDKKRTSEKYRDLEETESKIIERQKSEYLRFLETYGVDCSNLDNYDVVIDTSFSDPESVASLIIKKFNSWRIGSQFNKLWLSPRSLFPTQNIRELSSDNAKLLINVIKTEGFKEECAVDILKWKRKYFIFNGHKRSSAAIFNGISFLPVKIFASNEEPVFNGVNAINYIIDNTSISWIYDWEDCHNFRYAEYPTIE